MDKVKQIIVIRRDLRNSDGQKVSTGKLIVQGAHASIAFLTDKIRQHISRQDSGFPDMSINNVDVFSSHPLISMSFSMNSFLDHFL